MSALRESRFRGTAQVTVPDGAAGDAESPKHFLPRPDGPAPVASTSAPPAPAADPDGAVEAVDATLAVFDNSITSRGFFAARSAPARVTCEGGELRWAAADESGALRLDASSFRLVRGGASPTSFAGSLQTPQRHAAGAVEAHQAGALQRRLLVRRSGARVVAHVHRGGRGQAALLLRQRELVREPALARSRLERLAATAAEAS